MNKPPKRANKADYPKPICPYCNQPAKLVLGTQIYGDGFRYSTYLFWRCEPCEAHVGVHKGTKDPLGNLANAETRRARNAAHAAFDPLWKHKKLERNEAYERLAKILGIEKEFCHIGLFTTEQCRQVVQACKIISSQIWHNN